MVQVIRHVIRSMSVEAGNRIKFQNFGQSNYGSREVGEAIRTIEKALLLYLVYPCNSTTLPLFPDKKKSPRLQLLDTGLMNHLAGIQKEIIGTPLLENAYNGKVAEHLAVRIYSGQLEINTLTTPNGKTFYLLNLPLYLAGQIDKYLAWLDAKYPSQT